jgi:D-aminoacyl-tRNA deacylase
MILLVASNLDVASLNIAKQILGHYHFDKLSEDFAGNPTFEAIVGRRRVRLVTLNMESIHAQNLADLFNNLELVVFVSRHSSLSGTPTLSVHTSGNLGEAELGGIARRVSISPANAMRNALKAMARFKEKMELDYEVSYECTHHGPSLDVPAMFTELGSSVKQWNDVRAAEVVAHAAMEAISRFGDSSVKTVVGVGGPHYNRKFTRMALEEDLAFGHMIPKYAVSGVDSEILRQCVERTLEKVDAVVLDWKGIKGVDKPKLVKMIETIGIQYTKV